jgi:hypothetical protein
MKQQRIYIVGTGNTIRLVRANHRNNALSHVAKSIINVKVASQDELVEAMTRGIQIEQTSETETKDLFPEVPEQAAA